jgi:hypothetical protein
MKAAGRNSSEACRTGWARSPPAGGYGDGGVTARSNTSSENENSHWRSPTIIRACVVHPGEQPSHLVRVRVDALGVRVVVAPEQHVGTGVVDVRYRSRRPGTMRAAGAGDSGSASRRAWASPTPGEPRRTRRGCSSATHPAGLVSIITMWRSGGARTPLLASSPAVRGAIVWWRRR